MSAECRTIAGAIRTAVWSAVGVTESYAFYGTLLSAKYSAVAGTVSTAVDVAEPYAEHEAICTTVTSANTDTDN